MLTNLICEVAVLGVLFRAWCGSNLSAFNYKRPATFLEHGGPHTSGGVVYSVQSMLLEAGGEVGDVAGRCCPGLATWAPFLWRGPSMRIHAVTG